MSPDPVQREYTHRRAGTHQPVTRLVSDSTTGVWFSGAAEAIFFATKSRSAFGLVSNLRMLGALHSLYH